MQTETLHTDTWKSSRYWWNFLKLSLLKTSQTWTVEQGRAWGIAREPWTECLAEKQSKTLYHHIMDPEALTHPPQLLVGALPAARATRNQQISIIQNQTNSEECKYRKLLQGYFECVSLVSYQIFSIWADKMRFSNYWCDRLSQFRAFLTTNRTFCHGPTLLPSVTSLRDLTSLGMTGKWAKDYSWNINITTN